MNGRLPGCLGHYDFDHIVAMAKKRFIDGLDTITLLQQAKTKCEKEEVVLISLVSLEDDKIKELQICCPHERDCRVLNCRIKLKHMLERKLTR